MKTFFGIILCVIIGNIALRILESFDMNIWLARLGACLIVGLCGILLYHFKQI